MKNQRHEELAYYDGSVNLEFSDEIADGVADLAASTEAAASNEWRRYISANPYRIHPNSD